MTREQIAQMVKALGPEVARELMDAAARSAPGRAEPGNAPRGTGVYASAENFGGFAKSVIAAGRRTGAAELVDAAKRLATPMSRRPFSSASSTRRVCWCPSSRAAK